MEQAARTDTGRQRTANEDAFFARAPVFVVADGMGGAQAGEVAARIAAEAFDSELSDDAQPEQELSRIAAAANRRIFELSRSDSSHSGMGTTLTGAMVADDEVSIVHVGDSRAYLFRDGELRQLTRDHSLVEELRRRGQLTADEAEEHPQRSIITRALGPEEDVNLDVHTHQARGGDVFLLCSDGLTSMVREDRLHEILSRAGSLDEVVDQLVREANQMGGRDNITVILFRLGGEDDEGDSERGLSATEPDTKEHEVPEHEVPERTTALETPIAAASETSAPARGVATGDTELRPPGPPPRRAPAPRGRRRRRRRLRAVLVTFAVLVVLGAIGAGAAAGIRSVYFVGQNDRGLVTLYRGVPYELPAGIKLYSTEYSSSVQTQTLRPFERRRLLDHELRSRDDAARLISDLEQGR